MSKALSSACLVLAICFGGSAWAGKPKIAVLGLEAAPGPSGAVDPETTQVARDITKELRQRVQSGASPYVIAPNSSKELTDEKLLMSCDNEAASCMVVIGAGLAADVLLYGRVERKGEAYRVSLKLLDIKDKTLQPVGDEMPVGGSVTGVSKRIYNKLIGEVAPVTGTLVIKARSQAGGAISSGTVMVDEDRKGALASGKLTVTGLAEGRHTVAVEAGGYRRFEETVTVRGGEQASLDALLIDKAVASSSSPNTLIWKASLGAGIAVAAAGGILSAYSY
ncbi:MAG TPA: PEGA domain-containing protein, partial [Solirubrobacterales bacterium]|nr:PEGA domain-containing protein [Solirubrobacterales bacterium]